VEAALKTPGEEVALVVVKMTGSDAAPQARGAVDLSDILAKYPTVFPPDLLTVALVTLSICMTTVPQLQLRYAGTLLLSMRR
jgi:hypothetical protein